MKYVDRGQGPLFYSYAPASTSTSTSTSEQDVPVFFHHGIGLSGDAWLPWLEGLFPQRPVLSVDMRGHGASVGLWADDVTLDTFVEDAEAVLEAEGYRECHFIGESFGGTVGLALAARRPESVKSLTVVSTAYEGSRIATLDEWPHLIESGQWAQWMTDQRLGPGGPETLRTWVERQNALAAPSAILGIATLLRRTDLSGELSSISCPTLIIAPTESPFVGTSLAKELYDHLATNAYPEVVYIPNARHGIVVSHADACRDIAARFIQRRTQGSV